MHAVVQDKVRMMAGDRRKRAAKSRQRGSDERQIAQYFAAGELAAAEKLCRRALRRNPQEAGLWHLLALVLLARSDANAAYSAAQRACSLAPRNADYTNTFALVQSNRGDAAGAESTWRELLERVPEHAESIYNLGRLLLDTGRAEQALASFERALTLRPGWANAHKNLGVARFALGDHAGAEAAYADAIRHDPRDAGSYRNLAGLRREADDFGGATTLYRTALDLQPDAATALRFALLAPIFPESSAAIAAHRARVRGNLRALEGRPVKLDDPARALGAPAFYSSYQGHDERDVMEAIGALVTSAWQPPSLMPRAANPTPRVVFVSAHFRRHTVGRLYAPLIERLPRDGYELCVLSIGRHDDALSARIAAGADRFACAGPDLAAARAALHELRADVIVYCDIGMDDVSYYLASERLAPVQCASWGHPVTSGLPNVDYFLSSRLIEPHDGERHYTEALEKLPAWLTVYEAPVPDPAPIGRDAFGFAPGENVYLCPQSMFKLHPDFDAYLAAILDRDERAVVTLIDSRSEWRKRLQARLARSVGARAERIRFLPRQDRAQYLALLDAADVVLDTVHFAGGYTTFETLWLGKPFVTERGRFMRGRVSAGLCDLLDLSEPIAEGAEGYADTAVAFATDAAFRDRYLAALAARKRRLLELDDTVLPAYGALFRRLLAEADTGRARRMAS